MPNIWTDKTRINQLAYPTYYSLRFNLSIAVRKSKDVKKTNLIYGIMGDFWQSTIREKEIAKARSALRTAKQSVTRAEENLQMLEKCNRQQ